MGEEQELEAGGLLIEHVNYVAFSDLPREGAEVSVKIRYTAALSPTRAVPEGNHVRLIFAHPLRAIAPGQAAVCYDGDVVAFGGIIAE